MEPHGTRAATREHSNAQQLHQKREVQTGMTAQTEAQAPRLEARASDSSRDPSCSVRKAGRKSPWLGLVARAVNGFGLSIIAIGFARAWLSFQTGIVASFDTSIALVDGLEWARSLTLVLATALLSFVRIGPKFEKNRTACSLALGALGAALYAVALYVVPDGTTANSILAVALVTLFCWMLRLWCEDNCTADMRVILVRLCLSFLAQYLLYSVAFLVPGPVQQVIAIATPLLIMACLATRPRPGVIGEFPADEPGRPAKQGPAQITTTATMPSFGPLGIAALAFVIVASCASHGLLFSFSEKVTGTWLLGSLVMAGICLFAAVTLRARALFRGFACIAIATQCASAVLTLLFQNSADWISFAKSMSYAVSMVLTFSIACYIGSIGSGRSKAGMRATRWVSLYFVAFYSASYINLAIRPDGLESLFIVLTLLVLSAVFMLGVDWSGIAQADAGPGEADAADPFAGTIHRQGTPAVDLVIERIAAGRGLTPKELDVLALLLRGGSSKDIADASQVSVNTVRSQVQSIYHKLDIHSREELMEMADACR